MLALCKNKNFKIKGFGFKSGFLKIQIKIFADLNSAFLEFGKHPSIMLLPPPPF